MKILFLGDVIGRPGREALKWIAPTLIKEADFCIVNGENAAGGNGITPQIAEELFSLGVNVITTGNHIWDKKEIIPYLEKQPRLLRPANYPPGTPGVGSGVFLSRKGKKIGVINVGGRVFMPCIECPFRKCEEEIKKIKEKTSGIIIVDIHGEATSEKMALGYYLDGKVTAVVGTHTHVQTADERILEKGTAYITDVGMVGSEDSVIGMGKEEVIKRFLTLLPVRFKPAKGTIRINGLWIEVDEATGSAIRVTRINERLT